MTTTPYREKPKRPSKKSDSGNDRPARFMRAAKGKAKESDTRIALLDAAEQIMRKEGYAAVTSRRIANYAKITHQLVHYHFRNMDDLFLSIWRRNVDKNVELHQQLLVSANPLRSLWEHTLNVTDTALENEFIALSRHNDAVRQQMVEDGKLFRQMKVDLVSNAFEALHLDKDDYDAEMFVVIITNIARGLVMEGDVGLSDGHAKVLRYFEDRLSGYELSSETIILPAAS